MLNWKYELRDRNGNSLSLGLALGSCVSDRDGKIISVYMSVFSKAIFSGKIILCDFQTCLGHNTGALKKLVSGVAGEKFALMAQSDLKFTFRIYKSTKPFKELKKSDPLFRKKKSSLLQDIFINCLDHHCGKCLCKSVFNIQCKEKSSNLININTPKGKILEKNLRIVYHEFTKLFSTMVDKKTTAKIENKNSSIARMVPKSLDFKATYEGRVNHVLLSLILKSDFYFSLFHQSQLPLCSFTQYSLKKIDFENEKKSLRNKSSSTKTKRYQNLQRLREINKKRDKLEESYYSESLDEKNERLTSFADMGTIKNMKGYTKKTPKFKNLKTPSTYSDLQLIKSATKDGNTCTYVYECNYCSKSSKQISFDNEEQLMTHFSANHKSAKKKNWKNNIIKKLQVNEKKKTKKKSAND